MSYFGYFQLKGLQNCQMSKFEVQKIEVTPDPLESDLLNKISLEPKISDLFFQISNFDTWQLCSPLPFKDERYLI